MPYTAFGLNLSFEPQPPGAWRRGVGGKSVVTVRLAAIEDVEGRWSGAAGIGWEAQIDGDRFLVERGLAGDYRFLHGVGLTAHLSVAASELLCAIGEPGDPMAWRVLLDSVLFSVALLAGFEAMHAGAVATERGAVAITAGAGGGKSTLLAELLAGGAELLSDDILVLEGHGNAAPFAHPGPPLMSVPTDLGRAPGQTIASLADERWMAVSTATEPRPMAGLVVLDRRPGLRLDIVPVEEPLAALMGSLLRFPRNPERERARFELAGAIAANVPVWRLTAEPDVPPDELTPVLRAGLDL